LNRYKNCLNLALAKKFNSYFPFIRLIDFFRNFVHGQLYKNNRYIFFKKKKKEEEEEEPGGSCV